MLDLDPAPGERRDPDGRDGSRAPIPWSPDPPHGWEGDKPWLPFPPEANVCNVQTQREQPGSMATLYRRLIGLHKASPTLRYGSWASLEVPPGTFGYRRTYGDQQAVVLINLGAKDRHVSLPGQWEIGIDSRAREGEGDRSTFDGVVQPDQALVLTPLGTDILGNDRPASSASNAPDER